MPKYEVNLILNFAAYFLWQLENPKALSDRRFFKRYLTFWHMYNICSDCFFLIGLLMKLMENLLVTENEGKLGMIDMNQLAASGRILWGAAFSLAILKTIKVAIIKHKPHDQIHHHKSNQKLCYTI